MMRFFPWTWQILSLITVIGISSSGRCELVTEPVQINCTTSPTICPEVCNDKNIKMSSTFCDPISGSCVCDCRDVLDKSCIKTPFTPCFQDCVRKNPNPDVFLYEGSECPQEKEKGQVCACECTLREDYVETNDIS